MEILTSSLSFSKGKWLYSGALTDQTDSIFLSLSFREGKHFLAVYGVLSAAQDFNFILLAHDKAEDFFPLGNEFPGKSSLADLFARYGSWSPKTTVSSLLAPESECSFFGKIARDCPSFYSCPKSGTKELTFRRCCVLANLFAFNSNQHPLRTEAFIQVPKSRQRTSFLDTNLA